MSLNYTEVKACNSIFEVNIFTNFNKSCSN